MFLDFSSFCKVFGFRKRCLNVFRGLRFSKRFLGVEKVLNVLEVLKVFDKVIKV